MDARPPLGSKTDNRFLMTRDERENKVALPSAGAPLTGPIVDGRYDKP